MPNVVIGKIEFGKDLIFDKKCNNFAEVPFVIKWYTADDYTKLIVDDSDSAPNPILVDKCYIMPYRWYAIGIGQLSPDQEYGDEGAVICYSNILGLKNVFHTKVEKFDYTNNTGVQSNTKWDHFGDVLFDEMVRSTISEFVHKANIRRRKRSVYWSRDDIPDILKDEDVVSIIDTPELKFGCFSENNVLYKFHEFVKNYMEETEAPKTALSNDASELLDANCKNPKEAAKACDEILAEEEKKTEEISAEKKKFDVLMGRFTPKKK